MGKLIINNIILILSFCFTFISFFTQEVKAIELQKEQLEKRIEFLKDFYEFKIKLTKSNTLESNSLRAMISNDYEYFKNLNDKKQTITQYPDFFIEMSAYFLEDTRILDILLENNISVINTYAVANALKSRNFAFLEHLFNKDEYYVNSNYFINSAKMEAFGKKDLEEFIKKYPAKYNNYDKKNFSFYIKNFDKETIDKYINEGFVFNKVVLKRLIAIAKEKEDIAYLKNLYKNAPDTMKKYQEPPLLAEIESSKTSLNAIKWFIENKYDIYEKNKFGENALAVAVREKKEDVILYLLEKEMKVDEEFVIKTSFNKKENKFETMKFRNLYTASKYQGLTKVQKFLEENYDY